MTSEMKLAHLQMVQGVIERLAGMSMSVKEWAVTLVAGFFALVDKDLEWQFYSVAFVPIVCFWLLDGYYLGTERAFRRLYDEVRMKNESQIDFGMKPTATKCQHIGGCFAWHSVIFFGMLSLATGGIVWLLSAKTSP